MNGSDWTADAIDTLRQMWAEGASFSEIGNRIRKTRCAVAGKVRRLKLPSRGHEHFRQQAAKAARRRWDAIPREQKPKFFRLTPTRPKERKPPMLLRVVSVPDSIPVPLMERTGCCYPTTIDGPHLFCNVPTAKGDYCEFHHKVMYPRGNVWNTRNN